MIYLITDFGAEDIYVGQVKAVLHALAPTVHVVDLLHSAANFDVAAAAHLTAAFATHLPVGAVILAVVDPGVGGARRPLALNADGRWYVGPDNGLLSVVAARAASSQAWEIVWRPESLAPTFHGRDLFAPVVAMLARGDAPEGMLHSLDNLQVAFGAADLARIIYVDHYGNAMTGLRGTGLHRESRLEVAGRVVPFAPVFSAVTRGEAFWYENSLGLVEVAVNCGSAASALNLEIGSAVSVIAR